MKSEIPIRVNKVTQTGAKTQLGGLKGGLFNEAYQVEIAGVVKIDPTTPASWQMITAASSLRISRDLDSFNVSPATGCASPSVSNRTLLYNNFEPEPFPSACKHCHCFYHGT
jgi:hypothetical protein